ncbi:MAG: adenylate/guanylate cyclase domain-containing protein [Colwellia sp.]|nr:adenylate/guanylate cyclase domain-containing protein [Colwellia sp.]
MFSRLWSKHFFFGILLTVFVINIHFINIASVQQLLQRVEGILYDIRLLATLPKTPRQFDEQVVIIDIDEKSMREQGRYPWSRSKVSELVKNLMDAGVVVIGFDVFFSEAERNPVEQIIEKNQQLPLVLSQQILDLASSVDADKTFASTLKEAEVVLGFLFDNSAHSTGLLPESIIDWKIAAGQKSEIGVYSSALANIDIIQSSASGAGFINSVPESDGFIRKASLVLSYQDKLYPSLALEVARVYTLADRIEAVSKSSKGISWLQGLTFGKQLIPTNEKGQVLIPFKGKKYSFPYISATDVLNHRVAPELLDGAVAFIGTSAVGLADLRTTSVGVQYPGVEVHANVFESLIHPEILPVEPDTTLAIIFTLLIFTGLILSFSMTKQGPVVILVITVLSLTLHMGLNWYLWSAMKISLPLFQILLLILLLSLYYGGSGFISENNKRKQIKSMFNQYVPPAYIDKLLRSGKGLDLKSERRIMSVLFADIRNFTTLSEQFTAEELSDFMQQYLTEVTGIIFNNHGTIDKYVGDMVMAFWNAPLDDEKHAYNAVMTALSMIRATEKLTLIFQEKNWPAVTIGVGISSGEMNVGDMGSSYRKAYTVLGDAVNLGSRIESLTKYYGVDILINEQTYQQVTTEGVVCRKIDRIKVKGKHEAVNVYQPLGLEHEVDEKIKDYLQLHHQAMTSYLAGDWQQAQDMFDQLKYSGLLSTKVYDIYLTRLQALEGTLVNEHWDGVFSHSEK